MVSEKKVTRFGSAVLTFIGYQTNKPTYNILYTIYNIKYTIYNIQYTIYNIYMLYSF